MLDALELGPEQLDAADGHVHESTVFRLMELATELSGDDTLGLRWIELQMERCFGPLAHMVVYAKTLREAFALVAQFEALIYEGRPPYELIESASSFSVRARGWLPPTARSQMFAAESLMSGFLKLVRVYFANARPVYVRFEHAAPAHAAAYERLFGTRVEFDRATTEIAFDRGLLDAPSPHADPQMYAAQRSIAEKRLLRITQQAPYAVRVRALLLERFPARLNMDAVARALNVSERSLRNALGEEGTSFREVEYAALGSIARELLQEPRRTIQEAAYQMGFSDATTFHRAVKRWTGMTPSALRDVR